MQSYVNNREGRISTYFCDDEKEKEASHSRNK
ncbi:MAG: hypothetical protein K0Q95_927 [Bacteroidota bacterium]|jgi:hypothetical protein|nr:hypothetical protein [Bacteroidota bacterium]